MVKTTLKAFTLINCKVWIFYRSTCELLQFKTFIQKLLNLCTINNNFCPFLLVVRVIRIFWQNILQNFHTGFLIFILNNSEINWCLNTLQIAASQKFYN